MNTIDLLTRRRSVTAKDLIEPGPDNSQIQTLLRCAHRVPDHGKLGPWRFVVFQGQAREDFGQKLADIFASKNPDCSAKLLQFQRDTLTRAPTVIAVISTAKEHVKIPIWEQVLSAGAACQNLLVAAHGMGFAAQWLTEWYSYDEDVATVLKLDATDRIAGFIYIGSSAETPDDRVRPSLDERVEYWQ